MKYAKIGLKLELVHNGGQRKRGCHGNCSLKLVSGHGDATLDTTNNTSKWD